MTGIAGMFTSKSSTTIPQGQHEQVAERMPLSQQVFSGLLKKKKKKKKKNQNPKHVVV